MSAHLVEYYRRELATTLAFNLAYRGAVAIWVLSVVVEPIVLIAVWRTVTGTGTTGSYTADQFVAYYLVLMVVGHLTFIWHMYEFDFRIRTGAFTPLLLRPVHPVHHDVCQSLTYKLVGLVGLLPAAVALAFAFGADFSATTPLAALAFLPVLALAMAVRFLLEWCLALAAFWLTKVSALNALYASVFAFLAGQFAPLEVLPAALQTVAAWTPFPWMLAFPVEVLLGRRTGTDLLVGVAVQLLWVGVGVVALRWLWRRAARRYSAVGA